MTQAMQKTSEAALGCVLAVEDDNTTRIILTTFLEEQGYETLEAENGPDALEIIAREAARIDVIVLDKVMPEMDGIEVVKRLKMSAGFENIPIVMATGSKKPEEIKEGIDAGVFYYMIKPYDFAVFQSVMTAAMTESHRLKKLKSELKKHQKSFSYIDTANFTVARLEEAEDLACFLACCFPSPETALPGLANLLVNAVEHGNLEIGYDLKSDLMESGIWRPEAEKRENQPEYSGRVVKVALIRNDQESRVTITDEGKGFDWASYLEIDPSRALDNHGRGIAQANQISFDELVFNDQGNKVTAIARNGTGIKW